MKKILLTGANGFIGKNILESYLSQKYDIETPHHSEVNWSDTKEVDSYFKDKYFDAVWHFAIKPGHRNAPDLNNLFYTNVRNFENLARNCASYGKFINAGSGAIYDVAQNNSGVSEHDIYKNMGKDDHSFCKYVVGKRIDSLPNFIDLNIFGIFGKYEDYSIRFISNAICKVLFDLPITCRQNRRFSYLDVNDLPPILEFFTENEVKYKHYNVCPDNFVELKQLAEMVKEISHKDVEIQISKDGYGLDYYGDNSRLRSEFPNLRLTPIYQSVKNLYDYYEKHKDSIEYKQLLEDK